MHPKNGMKAKLYIKVQGTPVMIRIVKCFICLSFFLTLNVYAESGYKKGTVEYVRIHDAQIYPDWEPPLFWFTLNEVTSAGSCQTWDGKIGRAHV